MNHTSQLTEDIGEGKAL